METPDKYTLTVQFDAPNPFVVDALPALPMMDPLTFQQAGVNKPVGTGPFTFTEWIQGEKITLKKNPNYWEKGKPYLDQLEFTIFTDPQAMISHFQAGALGRRDSAHTERLGAYPEGAKAQALINPNSGNYLAVAFNVTQPPTDNKFVRQALSWRSTGKRVAQTVWQSVEKPIALLWFPTSPAYDAPRMSCTRSTSTKLAQRWRKPGCRRLRSIITIHQPIPSTRYRANLASGPG